LENTSPAPIAATEKAGADWGKQPVGTGAFKFVEWEPGQRIVLERNKDYYRQGVPYLDKLTFEFGRYCCKSSLNRATNSDSLGPEMIWMGEGR
jgi:ABC-type transport system substrate-binding protein